MSGMEPLAVIGAISSVIALIETTKKLADAMRSATGLPDSFQKVADMVSLVHITFQNMKLLQERKQVKDSQIQDSAERKEAEDRSAPVMNVIEDCKMNVQKLNGIFEQALTKAKDSTGRRFWKAARSLRPGQSEKVEKLMKEILNGLAVLQSHKTFEDAVCGDELERAQAGLSKRATVDRPEDEALGVHSNPTSDETPRKIYTNPERTFSNSFHMGSVENVFNNHQSNVKNQAQIMDIRAQTVSL